MHNWHKVSVILLFLLKGSNNLKCSQQRSKILKRTKLKLAMEIKTGSSNQVKKKKKKKEDTFDSSSRSFSAETIMNYIWHSQNDPKSEQKSRSHYVKEVPQLLQNIFLLSAFL